MYTKRGFSITDNPDDADVFVCKRLSDFTLPILTKNRLNVVWTNEPFHSFDVTPVVNWNGHEVHVFNVYNGRVYTDNFYHLYKVRTVEQPAKDGAADLKDKTIVAVMTKKSREMVVDGRDRSLTAYRQKLAWDGFVSGGIKIFGGNWGEGVSPGDSRHVGDRRQGKLEILSGFNFNLCVENCLWDYYVTEKIWESIAGGCLPIYCPSDSVLQCAELDAAVMIDLDTTYDQLRGAIDNISDREFVERLTELTGCFVRARNKELGIKSRQRTQRLFVNFLRAYI